MLVAIVGAVVAVAAVAVAVAVAVLGAVVVAVLGVVAVAVLVLMQLRSLNFKYRCSDFPVGLPSLALCCAVLCSAVLCYVVVMFQWDSFFLFCVSVVRWVVVNVLKDVLDRHTKRCK